MVTQWDLFFFQTLWTNMFQSRPQTNNTFFSDYKQNEVTLFVSEDHELGSFFFQVFPEESKQSRVK